MPASASVTPHSGPRRRRIWSLRIRRRDLSRKEHTATPLDSQTEARGCRPGRKANASARRESASQRALAPSRSTAFIASPLRRRTSRSASAQLVAFSKNHCPRTKKRDLRGCSDGKGRSFVLNPSFPQVTLHALSPRRNQHSHFGSFCPRNPKNAQDAKPYNHESSPRISTRKKQVASMEKRARVHACIKRAPL